MLRNIHLDHLSVCVNQSVGQSICRSAKCIVSCVKTADWIRVSFGVMSGVGQRMGVLDGGGDR